MRRTIYYYYNRHAGLVFRYSDSNGNYATHSYMFYSFREALRRFREALRRFRKEFGLEHKPIKLVDLYKKPIGNNQPEKRDFREHI